MHPNDFVMARIQQLEAEQRKKHDAAFASDLGFKPGRWPLTLAFEGQQLSRGHKPSYNPEGEIEGYVYSSESLTLVVWND